ncbi:MAG: phosphodiesterase, partial [Armatimonadota bacterium]
VGRRGAPEAPQTGAHRREGLLLAAGAGIRRGEVSGAAVEDIMPTVLHLCGLPVPGYCDGRVLSDLLAEPPDVRIDADAYLASAGEAASADPAVAERLRALGYL